MKLLKLLSKILWVLFITCMVSIPIVLIPVPCVASVFANNPEPIYLFCGKMFGLLMLFGSFSGLASQGIEVALA